MRKSNSKPPEQSSCKQTNFANFAAHVAACSQVAVVLARQELRWRLPIFGCFEHWVGKVLLEALQCLACTVEVVEIQIMLE